MATWSRTDALPGQGRRVLQIFCPGAASHMDLWEHKPALEKWHGKPLPGEENFVSFQGKNGNLMKSPWPFVACGESGKMISSMLPHMARHVDDIAFVHSMTSKTNTHGPGCVFMNTGHATEGFPSAGAWLSYALGSDNENLPTYVAIPDIRGEPPNGKANWSNGFLPAQHQAIMMSAQQPIRNLALPTDVSGEQERATRDFLELLNQQHAEAHPGDSELQARMAAYELAARMQLSAPEVADLDSRAAVDPPTLRHGRCKSTEGRLRAKLPAGPTAAGTRRALRQPLLRVPGVGSRRPAELGRPQDAQAGLRTPLPDLRPADRRAADRFEAARPAGRHARALDDRVRSHAHASGGHDRPRPQPGRLHLLDDGRRRQGGHQLRRDRRIRPPCRGRCDHRLGFLRHRPAPSGLRPPKLTYYHNGLDRRLTDVHGNVITELLA